MTPNYYMMWIELEEEIRRLEEIGHTDIDLGDLQRIMHELYLDNRD
ncbi:hypothetical protein [Paenibacillus sp. XY044]|nr:hypothetical protein [Paenibacillus sp. XY044]